MDIPALQRLLDRGRDSALLRFGLGKALLDAGDTAEAVIHLQRCVAQDPQYSAVWKWLGKAHLAVGDPDAAAQAWHQGRSVAGINGDKQAVKEMAVFLRRLQKASAGPA